MPEPVRQIRLCLDCTTIGEITQSGRCSTCGSNAVVLPERTGAWLIDRQKSVDEAERIFALPSRRKVMRLSDAILMGDSLKKCDPESWLSKDGSCGCAIGGALLAAGAFTPEVQKRGKIELKSVWPWLTMSFVDHISHLYREVAAGKKTIEDVCDYVRSIEPAEEIAALPEYEIDPRDEEPWSDSDTTREMQNSIKGR